MILLHLALLVKHTHTVQVLKKKNRWRLKMEHLPWDSLNEQCLFTFSTRSRSLADFNSRKFQFADCVTHVVLSFTGAVGRLIRRRPSQQQLRSEDPDASKCKLPRSQSERILGTKKHCGGEEDGFSVQELTASYGKFIYGCRLHKYGPEKAMLVIL